MPHKIFVEGQDGVGRWIDAGSEPVIMPENLPNNWLDPAVRFPTEADRQAYLERRLKEIRAKNRAKHLAERR